MTKTTFSNEQLCVAWAKQAGAEPKGTRGDVVNDLMEQMGVEADEVAFKKTYNNVTQRVRQLTNHAEAPIKFPQLEPGKKGARRTAEQMGALQALLNGDEDEDEESGLIT